MSAASTACWQINLQEGFGGGEVYTAFFVNALQNLGVQCHIFVSRRARWLKLLPNNTEVIKVDKAEEIPALLPSQRSWVLSHGGQPSDVARNLATKHLLSGIAHMPPQGRPNDLYEYFNCMFGVSAYVVEGLRDKGIPTWEMPLYGVASLHRGNDSIPLRQTSRYDWDKRKGRDRLLGWLEPLVEPLRKRPEFIRRPGITIGIVSRLTPIKQFPTLFEIIAPLFMKHQRIHLDFFGSGGYASVRDLRHALGPLGTRVRFWGQQRNVAQIYRQIDYLMTGLPELEALGLNVIEAQVCDTPVLAVNAPPFTETVIDGETGFLYRDPRKDDGVAFAALLDRIADPATRPHPAAAYNHLQKFSFEAFIERLQPIVAMVKLALQSNHGNPMTSLPDSSIN